MVNLFCVYLCLLLQITNCIVDILVLSIGLRLSKRGFLSRNLTKTSKICKIYVHVRNLSLKASKNLHLICHKQTRHEEGTNTHNQRQTIRQQTHILANTSTPAKLQYYYPITTLAVML